MSTTIPSIGTCKAHFNNIASLGYVSVPVGILLRLNNIISPMLNPPTGLGNSTPAIKCLFIELDVIL